MTESEGLDIYKALVDDAFRDTPLNLRRKKAAAILSEAQIHLTREQFQELRDYVYRSIDRRARASI